MSPISTDLNLPMCRNVKKACISVNSHLKIGRLFTDFQYKAKFPYEILTVISAKPQNLFNVRSPIQEHRDLLDFCPTQYLALMCVSTPFN